LNSQQLRVTTTNETTRFQILLIVTLLSLPSDVTFYSHRKLMRGARVKVISVKTCKNRYKNLQNALLIFKTQLFAYVYKFE